METVEYKNLSRTVCGAEGRANVCFLWRHFYQCKRGLIYVVNSGDRNKVVDAPDELSKSVKGEALDMVVFAVANTLTSSTVTRSGKELTDGRNEEF